MGYIIEIWIFPAGDERPQVAVLGTGTMRAMRFSSVQGITQRPEGRGGRFGGCPGFSLKKKCQYGVKSDDYWRVAPGVKYLAAGILVTGQVLPDNNSIRI